MIKLLTPEDFIIWKTIRLEAVQAHPSAFGASFEEDCQKSDEEWADALNRGFIFAYIVGERPVGVAGYYLNNKKKQQHRASLFTLYVEKGFRGHGIMDWLLEAISYHARDHRVEQLHLGVGTYNEAAIRCYERNGFVAYGTEPRALKLNGEYIDEYLMVKYL